QRSSAASQMAKLPRILKSNPLQLRHTANGTRGQHDSRNQMVRQVGSDDVNGRVIRIGAGAMKLCGLLPYRVVARHEEDASPLQRKNGVILIRIYSRRI